MIVSPKDGGCLLNPLCFLDEKFSTALRRKRSVEWMRCCD